MYCVSVCNHCFLLQLVETSGSESEGESQEDEDERDVLSFRHSDFTQSHHEEHVEGDLGLGTERMTTLEMTDESEL